MLHTLLLLLFLAFINGEDDNLKNALNSIENRQRQLASSYYLLPNKDTERGVQFDDDNLMYLDNNPPEYDIPHRGRVIHPAKFSENYRVYEDDSDSEVEEYQRALNDRLLEQLMLDILKNEEDLPARRPQKKSFFREREINEVSDNLQNLYPDASSDEAYPPPSPFRERFKSKQQSTHRRLVRPSEIEDEEEDYLNAISPLWKQYDGQSIQGIDPDTLTSEDVEGFLKYLGSRDFQTNGELSPELYLSENKDRDRSKRYWLSGQPSNVRYSIQKRSTKDEGTARPENKSKKLNATVESAKMNLTSSNKSQEVPKTEIKREKKGQKEVPVDLKSLKPLNIKKKSIDWSNYFGVDKRQKKSSSTPKEPPKSDVLLDQYIQSYILQSVRNSAFNNRGSDYRYFPKRDKYWEAESEDTNRRLETAEDLRTAEDLIIDHVLKYTGAHQGITDPVELQRFRERVIEELGAAYNLEKLRNEIYENSKPYPIDKRMKKQHQHMTNKRVAIKKENAELLPSDLDNLKRKQNSTNEYSHGVQKKNFNKFYSNPGYETNQIPNNQCPILNQIIEKCLEISSGVKDRENVFAPFCTLHHICNICGTKEDSLSCDLSFYSDVNSLCGDEPLCRYTAQKIQHTLQSQKVKSYVSANVCDPCIAQILQYSYTYE